MKTEFEKLGELRLLLNAAVAVLDFDRALYDVDVLLAGRKIAIPLIDSALNLSAPASVCHREIVLAKSLLGCKRRQYGNFTRGVAAAHLIAANTLCAHLIALEAVKLHGTPVSVIAADDERRRADRYFAEHKLPNPITGE
jgi:hypothetical protein